MPAKDESLTVRVSSAYKQLSSAATELNTVSDELGKFVSALDTALKKLNLGTLDLDSSRQPRRWTRQLFEARPWLLEGRWPVGHFPANDDRQPTTRLMCRTLRNGSSTMHRGRCASKPSRSCPTCSMAFIEDAEAATAQILWQQNVASSASGPHPQRDCVAPADEED